jgi:predicted lipoprotein with Yx(FWY)xxD motif
MAVACGRTGRRAWLPAVAVVLLLLGCGQVRPAPGGMTTSRGGSSGSGAPDHSFGTEVKARDSTLGRILVDGRGFTLYHYTAEDDGRLACLDAACTGLWPPLVLPGDVAGPAAGPGVDPAKLGVITRPDGRRQVTYGGYPLYYYRPDRAPGEVHGEDAKDARGIWLVVHP